MNESTLVMEARKRLLDVVPHLLIATEMARIQVPDGEIAMAVIATSPNGSGRITASFQGDFAKDLALILGFDPLADDNDDDDQAFSRERESKRREVSSAINDENYVNNP